MSPKVTESYIDEKVRAILEAAKRVFIEKGFFDTSMQDIVNECEISRGGLYRYFSSTEEIFRELLELDMNQDQEAFHCDMQKDMPGFEILKAFLEAEGKNILNIRSTLIPAAYEFFIRDMRDGGRADFAVKRHDRAVKSVNEVLEYSVRRGALSNSADLDAISNCIITFLEGLIISAVASVVDEHLIKRQIDAFHTMLTVFFQ